MNVIPIRTRYLKPNEGYELLVNSIVNNKIDNGDFIVISETPISTIEGNLVDESKYETSLSSIVIAEIWCKLIWGYILCPILGYSKRTTTNLRRMPKQARNHKEFILREYGLKHALQPTAEAGVDLSNVPGNYVSLLPENPLNSAKTIKKLVYEKSQIDVEVIIIDTDPTYLIRKTLFTTLPKSVKGIKNDTGIYGYILRAFGKKIGATPLASTINLDIPELIELANIAETSQRENSTDFFETIYNMKELFDVECSEVSIEMLDKITHIPAILIKKDNYL